MSRETFVMRDGELVGKKDGQRLALPNRKTIEAPMIMRDTPEYISPVTGRPVDGRVARREDLKRSGCVEAEPPKKKNSFINPRYAARAGVEVDHEAAAKYKPARRINPLETI